MSISSDVLGEKTTLSTFLESMLPYIDCDTPFDSGVINGAAYIITSGTLGSDGTTMRASIIGLLKKNQMIYGLFYSPIFRESRNEAISFINNLIVTDELLDSHTTNNFEWSVDNLSDSKKVTFSDLDREVSVVFPNIMELYLPGMGNDSKIPQYLLYTAEEMDNYMSTLKSTTNVYIVAKDLSDDTTVLLEFEKLPDSFAPLNKSGEYDEIYIKSYYDGISYSQGEYEKRVINGHTFYAFPNYSGGYKLRTFFGQYEVVLLCKTSDGLFLPSLITSLEEIAGSITVEDINTANAVSFVKQQDLTELKMIVNYPSQWVSFTRGMSDAELSEYNMTSSELDEMYLNSNTYMELLDYDHTCSYMISATDYEACEELSALSAEELSEAIDYISSSEYRDFMESVEIYETADSSIKYVKSRINMPENGMYCIYYYTIHDYKQITIFATCFKEIDIEIEKTADSFVDSILYY